MNLKEISPNEIDEWILNLINTNSNHIHANIFKERLICFKDCKFKFFFINTQFTGIF